MSVVIDGMDYPVNGCYDCPLVYDEIACTLIGGDLWHMKKGERLEGCPLRKPVRGVWQYEIIPKSLGYIMRCSICHGAFDVSSYYPDKPDWKFCPKCGVKMQRGCEF